jgi:hypothetical protein
MKSGEYGPRLGHFWPIWLLLEACHDFMKKELKEMATFWATLGLSKFITF